MTKELIKKDNIELNVYCEDWKEAIRNAGNLLIKTGYVNENYVDNMIENVKKLGPYIVIVPHIAIAHSRPSENVLKEGISMITLLNPVKFGNEANDPVDIVFSFGAKSKDIHLEELKGLAKIIENESIIEEIRQAKDREYVYKLINKL
ncbi:PTS sugar transporter subunit IIA [Maledivibacter halophilus]|uniref:Ascorbate-specific PTS system EIIA component n=1 Tax=Maledivibacter halophilus TaxID=36842 RepID=A0A1T5M8E7_9FIRM|nr:PTS sugar transporter subunit IIA [Maledivibacter halophilus]SKC84284.1 PTS system IIA component, L-Asc family [Maledivibacter halophilus]